MSSDPGECCVSAIVLGRVLDATIRIILGPGEGQLDGGIHTEVPLDKVPPDLRMPNTELEVILKRKSGEIVAVRARRRDQP